MRLLLFCKRKKKEKKEKKKLQIWKHLGVGTKGAHNVPTDVRGCHPKHLACVTVSSCDV